MSERVFNYPFSQIYPMYVQKVTRKNRTQEELDTVLTWLTGLSAQALHDDPDTLQAFFAKAQLNPAATKIKGVVCGVRVETIEDPLLQQIRWMDKVVDELAKGKVLEKIMRQ